MAFAKFQENRFRIDGEIAENRRRVDLYLITQSQTKSENGNHDNLTCHMSYVRCEFTPIAFNNLP